MLNLKLEFEIGIENGTGIENGIDFGIAIESGLKTEIGIVIDFEIEIEFEIEFLIQFEFGLEIAFGNWNPYWHRHGNGKKGIESGMKLKWKMEAAAISEIVSKIEEGVKTDTCNLYWK